MAKTTHTAILVSASILFTTLLISACGGGGGGGNTEPSGNGGGNPPPSAGVLNPGLSGHLFFEQKDQAWRMDMATGTFSRIPNTNWRTHTDRFPAADNSSTVFWAFPVEYDKAYDSYEFVLEVVNCKRHTTCIAIQDANGEYLSEFEVAYDVDGAIKLSRDRQYLALFRKEGIATGADAWLEIYNRAGKLVSSSREINSRDFAWLGDGSIVFANDRALGFTKPYLAEFDYSRDLINLPPGRLGHMAVSPDSRQLAFSVITTDSFIVTEAIPFIMDLDATGRIRQFATTLMSRPTISGPDWSPDGRWILVKEGGYIGTGTSTNPGSPGSFYAIPTEDKGKIYMLNTSADTRSPEVILIRRHKNISETPSTRWNIKAFETGRRAWQP
jgi:hypothetical protein